MQKKQSKFNVSKILYSTLFTALFLLFGYQAYKLAFIKGWPDLGIYMAATEQFYAGANPYEVVVHGSYIYPVFLCYILVPLTLIPPIIVQLIWYLISVASLVFSSIIIMKLLNVDKSKYMFFMAVISIIFISVIQDDLMHSNINSIILFLCVLGLYFIKKSQNIEGILFLSIAAAIKVSPIVFVIWLVIVFWTSKYGKFSVIVKAILMLTLILLLAFVIPYIIHGNEVIDWYAYYYENFIKKQMLHTGSSKYNFTLAGGLSSVIVGRDTPPGLFIKLLAGVVLCRLPLLFSSKTNDKTSSFIMFLVIILLTGTNGEQHHLILIIPAYIFILAFINSDMTNSFKISDKAVKWLLSLSLPISMLMILWGNNVKVFPVEMSGLLLIYYMVYFLSSKKYALLQLKHTND